MHRWWSEDRGRGSGEKSRSGFGRWVGGVVAAFLLALPASGDAESSQPMGGESPVPPSGDLEGVVALVTGSTSGLGREVALRLGSRGAHVVVHGRNEERGREVVRAIEVEGGSASFHAADFASLENVRDLADAVLSEYDRLDLLVNNAGVWLEPEDGRRLSQDGHELHLQVNYLAHFLLTELLLPRIVDSAPARIVNVASAAQRPIDFDDVMLEEAYSDGGAYAQSKLAQILHAFDLADELEGTGVEVNALHPATFMDTEMVLSRGAEPRSSVDDGADAVLQLLVDEGVGSGGYYNGLAPATPNAQAYDEDARRRLRELSLALTEPS